MCIGTTTKYGFLLQYNEKPFPKQLVDGYLLYAQSCLTYFTSFNFTFEGIDYFYSGNYFGKVMNTESLKTMKIINNKHLLLLVRQKTIPGMPCFIVYVIY